MMAWGASLIYSLMKLGKSFSKPQQTITLQSLWKWPSKRRATKETCFQVFLQKDSKRRESLWRLLRLASSHLILPWTSTSDCFLSPRTLSSELKSFPPCRRRALGFPFCWHWVLVEYSEEVGTVLWPTLWMKTTLCVQCAENRANSPSPSSQGNGFKGKYEDFRCFRNHSSLKPFSRCHAAKAAPSFGAELLQRCLLMSWPTLPSFKLVAPNVIAFATKCGEASI